MRAAGAVSRRERERAHLISIGIEARGALGGLPGRQPTAVYAGPCVNLGTDRALPGPSPFDDPGINNLSANTETALDLTFASGHVLAATDDAGNRQAFRTAGRVRVLDR